MIKKISGIPAMEPNDIAENTSYMIWQPAEKENEVAGV